MATVKMVRGDEFADIFDSPETIENAKLAGYTLVERAKPVIEEKKTVETKTTEKTVTHKRATAKK